MKSTEGLIQIWIEDRGMKIAKNKRASKSSPAIVYNNRVIMKIAITQRIFATSITTSTAILNLVIINFPYYAKPRPAWALTQDQYLYRALAGAISIVWPYTIERRTDCPHLRALKVARVFPGRLPPLSRLWHNRHRGCHNPDQNKYAKLRLGLF